MNDLIRNHQVLDPEAEDLSKDLAPTEVSAMQIEVSRAVQQAQASLVIPT